VKDKLIWVVAFIIFAVLAFLVDHGNTHLGVPDWIWLSLNLTVFLYLLARLVGKPITESLNARGEEITNQLTEAQAKLAEAERLRAEVRERLDKVETEVAEMRERAEAQGKAEAREILARDTAELTAKLTKELLAKTMTDADQERVLASSLDALADLKDKE
jgi:F-type H+-transporting ATPase subunit b